MEHYRLAILWAKWNGMQGTEKQVEKIMKQLSYYQLANMLKVRGVQI